MRPALTSAFSLLSQMRLAASRTLRVPACLTNPTSSAPGWEPVQFSDSPIGYSGNSRAYIKSRICGTMRGLTRRLRFVVWFEVKPDWARRRLPDD